MALLTKVGNALGMAVLEALELPAENVSSVRIYLEASGVATVIIERFLTNEEGERIGELLAGYKLVEQSHREIPTPEV